jgi:hypothetical protein
VSIVGMSEYTGLRPHSLKRHAALLVLSGLAPLLFATPASAHGGSSQVFVSAEKSNGVVIVRAKISYIDGHPNTTANPTARAFTAKKTVPIAMAAADASGTYVGTASLPDGSWHIVVTTSGSSPGTGKTLLNIPEPAARASRATSSTVPSIRTLGIGAAILMVFLLGTSGVVRRRIKRIVAARNR